MNSTEWNVHCTNKVAPSALLGANGISSHNISTHKLSQLSQTLLWRSSNIFFTSNYNLCFTDVNICRGGHQNSFCEWLWNYFFALNLLFQLLKAIVETLSCKWKVILVITWKWQGPLWHFLWIWLLCFKWIHYLLACGGGGRGRTLAPV